MIMMIMNQTPNDTSSTALEDNNNSKDHEQRHMKRLVWITIILLINALGTLANTILLLTLLTHKPLRQFFSFPLLLHCIAIDLYGTVVAVPGATVPVYLGPQWPLPAQYYHYQPLFVYMNYAASMYAGAVLAVQRLVATVKPHQFVCMTRRPALVTMLLIPWLAAPTINLFPTIGVGLRNIGSLPAALAGGCHYALTAGRRTAARPFLLYQVCQYYVPSAVIGVSYTVVLAVTTRTIGRRVGRRETAGCRDEAVPHSLRRRLEISRMLFISFLWQCLTVYSTMITPIVDDRTLMGSLSLQLFLSFLTTSFGAINPVRCVFLKQTSFSSDRMLAITIMSSFYCFVVRLNEYRIF